MVKCVGCGYLALRSNSTGQFIEANDEFRETGKPRQQLDASAYPLCFQKVIDIQEMSMGLPESIRGRPKRIIEIIETERSCEDYSSWRMGFGPREHLEMYPPAPEEWVLVLENIWKCTHRRPSHPNRRWLPDLVIEN